MASFNQITLIGNVGHLDVKTFADGNKVVNLTLATSERKRDDDREEITQWHSVVFRNKLAEIVEKYVKKGDPLFVTGAMRYRKYEGNDGVTRNVAEVYANNLQLLSRPPKGQAQQDDDIPSWM